MASARGVYDDKRWKMSTGMAMMRYTMIAIKRGRVAGDGVVAGFDGSGHSRSRASEACRRQCRFCITAFGVSFT